ncbi:MAG: hypothetical protein WBX01_10760 [Nitrososphaeraceae archaeon]
MSVGADVLEQIICSIKIWRAPTKHDMTLAIIFSLEYKDTKHATFTVQLGPKSDTYIYDTEIETN